MPKRGFMTSLAASVLDFDDDTVYLQPYQIPFQRETYPANSFYLKCRDHTRDIKQRNLVCQVTGAKRRLKIYSPYVKN